MPAKKTNAPNFETQLEELETLVERMEAGEQPLEQALRDFERGIGLVRACQKGLEQAEQKVQILLEKDGEAQIEDFGAPDES